MNRRVNSLWILALMLLCLSTQAIASEDYLECELSNGDKFVLVNKYDYSPLAKFTRHGASRTNQFGFLAYFKPNGSAQQKESLGTFGHFNVSDELQRKKACVQFFIFTGKVQSTGHIYIKFMAEK